MREFVVFTTQLYATASNSCRLVKTHYEYSEKGARQDRSTDKDGVLPRCVRGDSIHRRSHK